MSRRAPSTLADYLVVAISPALIMLLVGSLMFFLIEVFYQGQYPLRLQFVMAMFVMAIVCIARISMEEGAGYAALFGAPLAAVTALALSRFVQIEGALAAVSLPINLGLMALVWWAAHKLTWDCTLIDDSVDASGQGLLQEMGLDSSATGGRASGPPGTSMPYQLEATSAGGAEIDLPWWQRLFEADRRPHAPGVWVVYFSLLALPLFGIGGWFIPASATEVRQRAMLFLIVYVASGLTLLVSTSFLGLRRYLRQRALEMPIEMAATWVGLGLAMIAATLAVCYLLPRPDSLRSIADLPITFTSPDRRANRMAVGSEGTQQQEQQASAHASQPKSGQTGQQEGGAGKAGGKEASGGGSAGQGKQASGRSSQPSGGKADENSNSAGEARPAKAGQALKDGGNPGASARQTSSGDDASKAMNAAEKANGKSKQGSGAPSTVNAAETKSGDTAPTQEGDASPAASQSPPMQEPSAKSTEAQTNDSSTRHNSPPANSPPPFSIEWGGLLPWLARVLLFLAMAIAAAWLAWRYRVEVIAAWHKLLAELGELWERLFGRRRASELAAAESLPAGPVHRSFASYANPFATGAAARMSWPELVGYTFQALEAWARERGHSREVGQTPHEFALTLGQAQPQLHRLLPALADAYGQIAYAPARASAATVEPLRQLWSALQAEAARNRSTA